MDSLECQTFTATPAEPGDLPCWFSKPTTQGKEGWCASVDDREAGGLFRADFVLV